MGFGGHGRGALGRAGFSGDVFHGEEDEGWLVWAGSDAAAVEEEGFGADEGEFLIEAEVFEGGFVGEDFGEEVVEWGAGPGAVGEVLEGAAFGTFCFGVEAAVEAAVGEFDFEVVVEDEEGFSHGGDDGFGEGASGLGFGEIFFEGVDVLEGEDDAVDAIVGGFVRADAEEEPAVVGVLDVEFFDAEGFEDAVDEVDEVGEEEFDFEVGDGAADVAGEDVEEFDGFGGEAADAEIVAEHDDGEVDGAEEVDHVIAEFLEFEVTVLEFFVEGDEFFVGGLEFLGGGLHFFIGAVEFFVAGEDFFVGGAEFFVRSFLF